MNEYQVGDEVLAAKDMGSHACKGDVLVIKLTELKTMGYPLLVRNVTTPGESFFTDFDEVIKKPL